MDYEIYLPEALQIVTAWEIDPEDFPQAVNDHARLMCGLNLEPSTDLPHCSPYEALRF